MHLRLGLAVLVQLDGYLRPSEVLSLTREHLVPPSGPRYPLWGIVVCLSELGERTKTGTTDDSIFIGDLSARSWMSPGLNLSYWRSRLQRSPNSSATPRRLCNLTFPDTQVLPTTEHIRVEPWMKSRSEDAGLPGAV